MALSFPYPTQGTVKRPPGQGCVGCVHFDICPAVFWMRRFGIEGRTFDNHMGIQCASWSNNPADQIVTPPTADDLNEADYMTIQGITSEPDRCGLTDSVTATNRSGG